MRTTIKSFFESPSLPAIWPRATRAAVEARQIKTKPKKRHNIPVSHLLKRKGAHAISHIRFGIAVELRQFLVVNGPISLCQFLLRPIDSSKEIDPRHPKESRERKLGQGTGDK